MNCPDCEGKMVTTEDSNNVYECQECGKVYLEEEDGQDFEEVEFVTE